MTPEQLDEIEKLAEAATPGPWAQEVWQGNDHTGGWAAIGFHQESTDCICEGEEERTACAGEFCADDRSQNDEEQAWKDAAFIRAMREHALPLVKALREARENHARDRTGWDETAEKMESLMRGLVQSREEHREDARKHREDALAWMQACYATFKERDEARALLAALKAEYRPADEVRAQLLAEIEAHAETKAEVERLRSAITRFVNQYPWQQGPEIQELKALKEGDR